jgi:hypothetical protein
MATLSDGLVVCYGEQHGTRQSEQRTMVRGLVTIAVLSVGFFPGMWWLAMAGEAAPRRPNILVARDKMIFAASWSGVYRTTRPVDTKPR